MTKKKSSKAKTRFRPKPYTGIGSRETPPEALLRLKQLSMFLANVGLLLRSGGADGADSAFEQGVLESENPDRLRVYLPWNGFNKRFHDGELYTAILAIPKLTQLVNDYHPFANHLTEVGFKFMRRNICQVLGKSLASPSKFVVCWAKQTTTDNKGRIKDVTGGTGMAVRIAYAHDIPVFNVHRDGEWGRLRKFLHENFDLNVSKVKCLGD